MANQTFEIFGAVEFRRGEYVRTSGTSNWSVQPIAGFDPPIRAPVGQIEITFAEPLAEPYGVVVTACREANAPLVSANYGNVTSRGFVVHLWETTADRTLQNGGFSFLVLRSPAP